MSEHLEIKVNGEVFKLKDPRVGRLRSGGMSVKAFALLVRPGDPFMLIGDTIYALTETEYYALRAVSPLSELSEAAFRHVLGLEDLSFMNDKDRTFLGKVRGDADTCTSCRYRRYKDEVYKLIKKYGIPLPDGLSAGAPADPREYPETSGSVAPLVSALLPRLCSATVPPRKSCIDCVEKHVAQAYVLSREFLQGYPEYLSVAVGHLAEALDELPADFRALKATLEFCIARTNCYSEPFVPLFLLLPLIRAARQSLNQSLGDQTDIRSDTSLFNLDITDDIASEISAMQEDMRKSAADKCRTVDDFLLRVENSDVVRVSWEGSMACLADYMADTAPKTANMIRNRRLLFNADPALSLESGYSMADLAEILSEGV